MTRTRPAPGREIGSVIGAVFGAVFVLINSIGVPAPVRAVAVVGALAALATVLVCAFRSTRRRTSPDALSPATPAADASSASAGRGSPFGRTYWLVVVIEVVALVAGTQILTRNGLPELGVAWVAVVVGTHFFALAVVFGLRRFHVLGVLVTLAGIAGFVVRATGATDAVGFVSGVGAGVVLLAFSLWAVTRG